MKNETLEMLRELVQSESLPALLELVEELGRAREADILRYSLDADPNPNKLLIAKARSEGARLLAADITSRLRALRPGKSKPGR